VNKNLNIIEKAKSIFLEGLNSFQKENFEVAERKFLEVLELVPDRLSAIQNLISNTVFVLCLNMLTNPNQLVI